MATSSVTNTNPATDVYAALNGTNTTKTTSTADSAQDRFLKLLTAQLKNQDPLNPMDNAQMTSQLAQISTVDGIEKLNATLQTMLGNSNATQTLQAASIVGHGVLVPGTGLVLSNSQAVGGFDLTGSADVVKVTIKDSNGLVVRTLDMGAQKAGSQTFVWDGKDDSGAAAAAGDYQISVSATQGQNKVDVTALQLGVVSSISGSGSGITLRVGSVGNFTLSDVRQII